MGTGGYSTNSYKNCWEKQNKGAMAVKSGITNLFTDISESDPVYENIIEEVETPKGMAKPKKKKKDRAVVRTNIAPEDGDAKKYFGGDDPIREDTEDGDT